MATATTTSISLVVAVVVAVVVAGLRGGGGRAREFGLGGPTETFRTARMGRASLDRRRHRAMVRLGKHKQTQHTPQRQPDPKRDKDQLIRIHVKIYLASLRKEGSSNANTTFTC